MNVQAVSFGATKASAAKKAAKGTAKKAAKAGIFAKSGKFIANETKAVGNGIANHKTATAVVVAGIIAASAGVKALYNKYVAKTEA